MMDLIDRQAVQEIVDRIGDIYPYRQIGNRESYSQYNEAWTDAINRVDAELNSLPSVDAVKVVRCKDCKHWRRQTNYAGAQLSFGFCESDDMWRSLYGETYEVSHIDTDDDFYCGYAERRQDG